MCRRGVGRNLIQCIKHKTGAQEIIKNLEKFGMQTLYMLLGGNLQENVILARDKIEKVKKCSYLKR